MQVTRTLACMTRTHSPTALQALIHPARYSTLVPVPVLCFTAQTSAIQHVPYCKVVLNYSTYSVVRAIRATGAGMPT